ncbi:MAG: hypothetical protein LW832_07360, partial [Parachlamydia sp.]|nr:hypothetical protein [Parachlamydia sp.]
VNAIGEKLSEEGSYRENVEEFENLKNKAILEGLDSLAYPKKINELLTNFLDRLPFNILNYFTEHPISNLSKDCTEGLTNFFID